MHDGRRILAFHQTANRFYPGINNIRPARFLDIVGLFDEWEVRLCGVAEMESQSPDRPAAAFTFDDGYVDNIDPIEELLSRGICPAVFIPTGYIGRHNSWDYSSRFCPARHLNRGQIRALAERGVVFGSHGVHHTPLTDGTGGSTARELNDSRRCLEDITGRAVDSISFPYGRVSPAVVATARESGYRRGYIMGSRPILETQYPEFIRSRVPVYGSDDYFSLRNKLLRRSRLETLKNHIIGMLASGAIIIRRRLK